MLRCGRGKIARNTCSSDDAKLVVLLPWLGAPKHAVEKYKRLYEEDEHEFYVYSANLKEFLWPKYGLSASRKVLDRITKITEARGKPFQCIVVHAFSVGCYFYSLMVLQMRRNMQKYKHIWDNISVHIMDSPVIGTTSEMAVGVGSMISKRQLLRRFFKSVCDTYFGVTHGHTVSIFQEAFENVKCHSPNVPSLILSSEDDLLCEPEAFGDFCDAWHKSKCVFKEKVWKDSEHVLHLRFHPEEYKKMLIDILSFPPNIKTPISQSML